MATLIRLAQQDNVAVATRNLSRGAVVAIDGEELTTRDPIRFAHKVAIRAIEQDGQVIKYGVPIGRAKVAIAPGQHVHVAQHQERICRQRGRLLRGRRDRRRRERSGRDRRVRLDDPAVRASMIKALDA